MHTARTVLIDVRSHDPVEDEKGPKRGRYTIEKLVTPAITAVTADATPFEERMRQFPTRMSFTGDMNEGYTPLLRKETQRHRIETYFES